MKIYFVAVHYGIAQKGYYVAADSEQEALELSGLPAHETLRIDWERAICEHDQITRPGRIRIIPKVPPKKELLAIFEDVS